MDVFVSWLVYVWELVLRFFNSVFFTGLAAAALGAFAGAYAAQRIATKGKYRDELLQEMRDINAAIMLAFAICNSLLGLKKQHTKRIKEQFDAQKATLLDFHAKRNAGLVPKDEELHVACDLQTLSLEPLPIDILQQQVFDKLSVGGRALSLTTTLRQTLHGLSASLERRNKLIEAYKANEIPFSVELYFGLPLKGGNVNMDYPSSIDAIYSQTNDGIFFSRMLCDDLVEHGRAVVKKFKENFKRGALRISEPEWSKAEKAGLMPYPADYADWVTMFKKRDSDAAMPPGKSG